MKQIVGVGVTVLAGAALIEAALIPGLLIGGAAVLAPRYLPKLPNLIPRRKPSATRRSAPTAAVSEQGRAKTSTSLLPKFAVGQAVAKTITYRLIVGTLDFTANYIVIGELSTAAGLSTLSLVAGPLFYFAHEAAWNYIGHPDSGVDIPLLDVEQQQGGIGRFMISRAGQDHCLPHIGDRRGFHRELCRGRQRRAGRDPVVNRLRARAVHLLRPRKGLGLSFEARRAPARNSGTETIARAGVGKPRARRCFKNPAARCRPLPSSRRKSGSGVRRAAGSIARHGCG